MPVDICLQEDVLIASLSGEIDHHTAKGMRATIDDAVERNVPQTLILDFGGVHFMDSSGIGLVIGRYRSMEFIGGKLEIHGVRGQLRKVMRVAGLDKLAKFEE